MKGIKMVGNGNTTQLKTTKSFYKWQNLNNKY